MMQACDAQKKAAWQAVIREFLEKRKEPKLEEVTKAFAKKKLNPMM